MNKEYYMFIELENKQIKAINLSKKSFELINYQLKEYGNYKILAYKWCNN